MPGKAKGAEPQPRPTVGGSFLLNDQTGAWERESTSVESLEPVSTSTETSSDDSESHS